MKSFSHAVFMLRCLCVLFGVLGFPVPSFAAKYVIDTGVIKIGLSQSGAGFIDDVHFDRNGDGAYADDELIVKQPAGEPGIFVSYILGRAEPRDGVSADRVMVGKAQVVRVKVDGLIALIEGRLHFDGHGATPFEIVIRGTRNSAALSLDFSFAPLRNVSGLSLGEASLRVYGVFDPRDPPAGRRSMSTGDFRNTPRPDSAYQPFVWQLGGHLVESPWYWRNWLSWSEDSGPVTTLEGAVPPKTLSFFMRDDRQGMRAMAIEPAAVAPLELAGTGLPANLGIFAWSPRVRPLPMHADLPERIELKGVGLQFFRMEVAALAGKGAQYSKAVDEQLAASEHVLARTLSPVRSSLRDPRLAPEQMRDRLRDLEAMPVRGWEANVLATPYPAGKAKEAAGTAFGDGWLALDIDRAVDRRGVPLPARGGVPFPRGVLNSSDSLRVVDGEGREIPAQMDTLAVWPDRSLKWVLVTLLSDAATATSPLRLEYGPRPGRRALPRDKLMITRTADGLSVDTGPLRFSLDRKSGELFGNLWYGLPGSVKPLMRGSRGRERANRMDLLALPSPAAYPPYAFHADGGQAVPSRATIEAITVEREGPLSAHLLVRGRYHYESLGLGRGDAYRNEGCEFWIRYTVYAGQSYVEVQHSYVFEGNPDREMIRELSLSVPLQFEGATTTSIGADGKVLVPPSGGSAGIYQDNPHAAELHFAAAGGGRERIHRMAGNADGWIDVRGSKGGVTFGVRNTRETYAKDLSFDDGELTIGLWPKRARLLDTRRYARQYGDGESSSFGQGTAQGVARTHEMFFYFHAGDADVAESATVARNLLQPALLKAPPAWYAGSEAAGAFKQADGTRYRQWENLIADGIDYFLYHRELWSWFGIYDYGDLQQVPNGRGGWARLAGRWGWANNEALIDMFLYEQFMRTGRRDYLDAALAMTRHAQEVDLINSTDYKGNRKVKMHGHRHNVNHWGDGYVGIRGAAPHGFRLGYFLTGDLRTLDLLRMGMDAHWESIHSYDKEHSSGLGYLSFFWEATGEDVYRDALKGYLDFQVKHFDKFGHIHSGLWNFRKDVNRALPAEALSGAPTIFFFQNFGAAYSLMELADLTGRQDVIKALIQFARDTVTQRTGTWEAQFCHYRLMAFAYRHTGDPRFLRYAVDQADKLGVAPNRRDWAHGSAITRFDNKLSMFAWTGQGLPYLMQAMDRRAKDPLPSFAIPPVLAMPAGKDRAPLAVDGSGTSAREGSIAAHEWQVDGASVSQQVRDTLWLAPGKREVSLSVTDSAGRHAVASQTTTVWEPGVIARLCFRGAAEGFVGGEYRDEKGYGYTRGTRITATSEPRRHGGKGCPEVHIAGSVRVKTGAGRYHLEMGGTDFWTESMGRVAVQGSPLKIAVTKESSKKLSWSHQGEVTIGPEGVLAVDFLPGAKGEPVVLAYIIVREVR
ncbi:MAG: hypothetical protein CVU34_09995 [Betaproteobacteria bacterium HGW-Betaproteobacteria-7]|nr:MAG: hypothetical protein CVU34_09995 [Betaproteobacteria bacterium HGW-Betaproteobacteria-7]